MSQQKLFRPEALSAQQTRWLGSILLIRPVGLKWFILFAAVFGLLVISFLCWGSYTQRSSMSGQLLPDAGLIRLYPRHAGVVLERRVREGQFVNKGDVLFVLTDDRNQRLADGATAADETIEGSAMAAEGASANAPRRGAAIAPDSGALSTVQQRAGDVALHNNLVENDMNHRQVIVASVAGVTTAVQGSVGEMASATRPLVQVIPSGSVLEAHLFAPSRAVGFLSEGEAVIIRIHSFPFQKFGTLTGTVVSVSQAAVPANELLRIGDVQTGGGRGEPLYTVVVRLAAQSIDAYGVARPLRAGMLLDADILLQRRKLFEWAIDPRQRKPAQP